MVNKEKPALPIALTRREKPTPISADGNLGYPALPLRLTEDKQRVIERPLSSSRIPGHSIRRAMLTTPPMLPAVVMDKAGVDPSQANQLSQRELQDLWKHVSFLLTGQVSRNTYDQVIAKLKPLSFDNGVLTLMSHHQLAINTAKDYHAARIRDLVQGELPPQTHLLAIDFAYQPQNSQQTTIIGHVADKASSPSADHAATRATNQDPSHSKPKASAKGKSLLPCPYGEDDALAPLYRSLALPLLPHMQFDDFLVDDSNLMAKAAAANVVASLNQGEEFPSLVIYGEHGCGKTHLLNAIGWQMQQLRPDLKCMLLRTHSFKHQFAKYMKTPTLIPFLDMLREMDVLLIDDIHQLPNKHGPSCEEFLNLLSDMRANGKTVVMTSVQHPSQLSHYGLALRSRFLESRLAELNPPNETLQYQVLRRLADRSGLADRLDDEGLHLIISRVQGGFRVLIGQMETLAHEAKHSQGEWNRQRINEFLDRQLGGPRRVTSVEIITGCCRFFGVSRAEFMSRRRQRTLTLCRHTAMYLAKEMTQKSLPEIGRDLGKLDHTSVLYGIRRVQTEISQNQNFAADVQDLQDRLLYGETVMDKGKQ